MFFIPAISSSPFQHIRIFLSYQLWLYSAPEIILYILHECYATFFDIKLHHDNLSPVSRELNEDAIVAATAIDALVLIYLGRTIITLKMQRPRLPCLEDSAQADQAASASRSSLSLPLTIPVLAQLQPTQACLTVLQSHFHFVLQINILGFPIQDLNVLNPIL